MQIKYTIFCPKSQLNAFYILYAPHYRPLVEMCEISEFKDSFREKEFNFTEDSLNYYCENIDKAICNLTDNIN